MDALYNWHVRRFYDSKAYRRRFASRLWQHRWSLWHLLRNLPRVIQAARYFSANKAQLEAQKREFAPHPDQPTRLQPFLSPELRADAIAAMSPIKISRRPRPETVQTAPENCRSCA
jgi:magnesium-protoporphyrin IX monomethyl ester (oxidative) cyclase